MTDAPGGLTAESFMNVVYDVAKTTSDKADEA